MTFMSRGLIVDPKQFREYVVRPTLLYLGDYRPNMENLLVGTAWHESKGCSYLHQLGGGPALGVFQIEPFTHHDQWGSYLNYHQAAHDLILKLASVRSMHDGRPDDSELIGNMPYACAIAWCKYKRAPQEMPAAADLRGLAEYWKHIYNSNGGAGTIDQWLADYPG
jgi:hypothetical protein